MARVDGVRTWPGGSKLSPPPSRSTLSMITVRSKPEVLRVALPNRLELSPISHLTHYELCMIIGWVMWQVEFTDEFESWWGETDHSATGRCRSSHRIDRIDRAVAWTTGRRPDCAALGIEHEQHSQRSALSSAELLHVLMPRRVNPVVQATARRFEQFDASCDCGLLLYGQFRPPRLELVSEFDLPHHHPIIIHNS